MKAIPSCEVMEVKKLQALTISAILYQRFFFFKKKTGALPFIKIGMKDYNLRVYRTTRIKKQA